MSRGLGPDYDRVYLSGQMSPDNPEYARMERIYGDTPEGKRIKLAREEDEEFLDGLERQGPAVFDLIMRTESIHYAGDPTDRLLKIHTIRMARRQKEKELLDRMSPAEKAEYEEKKKAELDAERKARVDSRRIAERTDVQAKAPREKMIKQRKLQHSVERDRQRAQHRADEQAQAAQASARAGNPVPALQQPAKPSKPQQVRRALQSAKKK